MLLTSVAFFMVALDALVVDQPRAGVPSDTGDRIALAVAGRL